MMIVKEERIKKLAVLSSWIFFSHKKSKNAIGIMKVLLLDHEKYDNSLSEESESNSR